MSTSVFIVFCLLLSTETILICIGNLFTICVFWKKRRILQKAYYLLTNLAIADLLVGIQEIISLGTQSAPFLFTFDLGPNDRRYHYSFLLSSLLILFSCSSVFSLAAIALERVYAVVWPLRHRTVKDRVYFGNITFIWVAGICAAVLFMLSIVQVLDPIFAAVPVNITILSSLCVVCTSYVIIRRRLRRPFPVFDSQTRRDMARNLKLSKTLFMVIGLSLICWAPAALLYAVQFVCQDCISQILMLVTQALHLANSIVNPVVYSYRMPVFKEELKRCLNKFNFLQRTGNNEACGPEIFDTPL